MADCDNDQECEKIVPTPIKPEPLPKQCSGGGESGEGTNDFNELENRPKYGGRAMTGDTNIPEVETYEDFIGTDGEESGTAGLVPAPEATDAGKFLKADGTWAEAGGGIPQYGDIINIGSNNTADSSNNVGIVIGKNAQLQSSSDQSIRIGTNGLCYGPYSIAIGYNAQSAAGNSGSMNGSIAIGRNAVSRSNAEIAIGAESGVSNGNLFGAISLGAYSSATRTGEVNIGSSNTSYGYNNTHYRVIGGVHDGIDDHDAATVGQIHYRQRKPVVVWEVDGEVVTTGLVAVGEDISANPNWQLTDLDLTPYKRIKIFTKAAQKAGATASASTTPAMVLEMSLDPRAAIAEYGGNYVGSMLAQKPNDANRLCTLTCAVSADKTKFEVLRMTSLYGTAATSNSDVNAYVFKIEGYYD